MGPAGPAVGINAFERVYDVYVAANQYPSGLTTGLSCPTGSTIVSGGYWFQDSNLRAKRSFIGDAWGYPRIYILEVIDKDGWTLPAGFVVRMVVTCL